MRYIDTESGNYLDGQYGRCDREHSCGYHAMPDHPKPAIKAPNLAPTKRKEPKPYFIPEELIQQRLTNYENNVLIKWMASLPGWDLPLAIETALRYRVGTVLKGDFANQPIFFMTGKDGKTGAGKIVRYSANGRRSKKPYNVHSIHAMLERKQKMKRGELVRRNHLFGLHLLNEGYRTIAIVESEKTAMIASVYLPEFYWMATQSMSNLNFIEAVTGYPIVLYPDLGAFDKWSQWAEKHPLAKIDVSTVLERNATQQDKEQGLDLADYLTRIHLHSARPTLAYPPDWDDIKQPA